jgi:hypothetical protein
MNPNNPAIQQLRNDLKSLKLRYTNVHELVYDRIVRLEKAIFELRKHHDEYTNTFNWLQRIETFIKSEQTSVGDAKLLYQQIEQCKNITKDLESIQLIASKLNDYVKHLYVTTQPSSDSKYLTKIKSDMHELNEKLMGLSHLNGQHERNLQDALKRTAKVDDEIENIDSWIERKERELVMFDETGVILSEDKFYENFKRYVEIKHDIDRKEPEIKNIFDTGNDLLKNSSSTGTVADLARNMINLNTKWTNFYKKADLKYKYFNELNDLIIELKRKIIFFFFFGLYFFFLCFV